MFKKSLVWTTAAATIFMSAACSTVTTEVNEAEKKAAAINPAEKVTSAQKTAEKTVEKAAKKTKKAVTKAKTASKKAVKKAAKPLTLEQAMKRTTTPVQYKRHAKRHAEKKAYAAANKDKIKILMLGDSITHQWEYKPAADAKKKYLDPYNVLNLGCGGDRTQNTLWIIEKSGILELINPRLVTIMIGTNNHRNDYRATTAGIKLIVEKVRARYPEAKILLYAIFPRGANNADWRRQVNEKVNAEIVKLCDGEKVVWVDIRQNFLTKEGVLTRKVMPDLLHPRLATSYAIWGESLLPYFEKYGK